MKREVRFYSTRPMNGVVTEAQSFFTKTVEVKSSTLPPIGLVVAPCFIARKQWKSHHLQSGVVTDAFTENGKQIICVGTPTPPEALQECLREEGDCKEVFGSPK